MRFHSITLSVLFISVFTLAAFAQQAVIARPFVTARDLAVAYAERNGRVADVRRTGGKPGQCARVSPFSGRTIYQCLQTEPGDEYGEVLSPFPLALPDTTSPLAGLDLGPVPLPQTINGAAVLRSWYQRAASKPLLRCRGDQCDKLVRFDSQAIAPGMPSSWLSICSVYRLGTSESLPMRCTGVAFVFDTQTWVTVPGQCMHCGGPEEGPEMFAHLGGPRVITASALSQAIQRKLEAGPWALETRRLGDSVIGHANLSAARFLTGWREKLTVRFDFESQAEGWNVYLSMFMLINRLNTFDPRDIHQAPKEVEQDYEKRLRALVIDSYRGACIESGGQPIVGDSRSADCR